MPVFKHVGGKLPRLQPHNALLKHIDVQRIEQALALGGKLGLRRALHHADFMLGALVAGLPKGANVVREARRLAADHLAANDQADALGPVGLNAGLRVGVPDGVRGQLDGPGDTRIRSCLLDTLELRVKRSIDPRQFREQGVLALKGVVALERRLNVCTVRGRIAQRERVGIAIQGRGDV